MASLSVDVFDLDGKLVRKAVLPADLFAGKVIRHIIHDVVRAEEAALRRGTAKTKTRGEISGGGKKPWKQKGTGRARAGSNRSPIWRGGGTVFGPVPHKYDYKINRKVRRIALAGALTSRLNEERVIAIDASGLETPKTRLVSAFLERFGDVKRPLLLHTADDDTLVRSIRNIRNAAYRHLDAIAVKPVMKSDLVILTASALESLSSRTGRNQSEDGDRA